jgi:heme exporter protein C
MSQTRTIEGSTDATGLVDRTAGAAGPVVVFDWFFWMALVALAAAAVRVFWFTPIELHQGAAQKIYYVHVPSAIVALYMAFPLMAVASGLYLWMREDRLDRLAESAAEVGLVFATVVLVTGPIWAKTVWGTWWTWDARLTSMLFLWFIIVGYLVLRGAVDDPAMRARYSAVLALLSIVLVPFIHLSVYMFRTLHPMPILLKPSAPSMPSEMVHTFLLAFGAMVLLFIALLRVRLRLANAQHRLDEAEGHV